MQEAYTALLSLVSLLGIWVLVLKLYRDYTVALFRQHLFILRDRLFDDAANGLIDFNHPAYCLLRRTMNGFIRFGHRLTLMEIILLWFSSRRTRYQNTKTYEENWGLATRGLNSQTKLCLDQYQAQMESLVIRHLILGSPEMLLTLIVPVISWVAFLTAKNYCKYIFAKLQSVLKLPIDDINSVAAIYGQ